MLFARCYILQVFLLTFIDSSATRSERLCGSLLAPTLLDACITSIKTVSHRFNIPYATPLFIKSYLHRLKANPIPFTPKN
ncbi:uncharacterized protein K460DRAFT_207024 [Cucurbitaria berberidis CBS 394.84]|uniref:Secreted protein n=1 Tax=Cucurbitaria berberidis CBS 394.84 TaxID=1168544 RepID=A0A9P4G7C4_9PLEO|nr:uncharacterized protein K460DRAFT_207024 [Cucurbitaria berberidis CBS 394.84]KAF1840375.1 hypothetical protein K460DRAFT_207024 [Cucurbitaria berberidis CBS 394.84]